MWHRSEGSHVLSFSPHSRKNSVSTYVNMREGLRASSAVTASSTVWTLACWISWCKP